MQLLNYPGGKARLANWIIGHFPQHDVYVEPFGGSAAVLLQKPPAKTEIYNDLDDGLRNFMEVLRDQRDRLAELIALTNYSDRKDTSPTSDPVERARRFFHDGNTCWHNGHFNGQVVNANGGGTLLGAWQHKKRNLIPAGERLARVTIIGLDAIECIKRYDSPETLFYVDPPYLGERKPGLYRVEMLDEASHIRLAAALKACRGHVVVSGYSTPLYEDLYAGWQRHMQLVKPRSKQSKLEVLWVKPHTADPLVASKPRPTRKSSAAYAKSTMRRAAINPDNGKVLPRGRPKKTGTVPICLTQEERAKLNAVSLRTQRKLDLIARSDPELAAQLATLISSKGLSISAAERIARGGQ